MSDLARSPLHDARSPIHTSVARRHSVLRRSGKSPRCWTYVISAIDGGRPWDPQIRNPRFFERVLAHGSLGAGESYMEGWWEVDALDEFFARIHRADPYSRVGRLETLALALKCRLFNYQTLSHADEVARDHYDLGNDLFAAMLDRRMQYTCAYWKNARTLDEAQENKLRLVCEKLYHSTRNESAGVGRRVRRPRAFPCQRIQLLGRELQHFPRTSGIWPAVMRESPRSFRTERLPLRGRGAGQFDRSYRSDCASMSAIRITLNLFDLAHRRLKDGGLFLLHTIGSNQSVTSTDAWIHKYVFPNGMLPSLSQLGRAAERGWVVEDIHNFGPDYDPTLRRLVG